MKSLDEFYGVQNPYMEKIREQAAQIDLLSVQNRQWRAHWEHMTFLGYFTTCGNIETNFPLISPADPGAGGWCT